MTKKKSLLLQSLFMLGACGALISMLMLAGCASDEKNANLEDCDPSPIVREEVPFDGEADFVTSDYDTITNQEIFDEMISFEESVYSLLDLVDEVVLRAIFCVDRDEVDEFITNLKDQVEDFDEFMVEQGFASEDEIKQIVELNSLRNQALRNNIVVTDEEVREFFENTFGDEEDADFDELEEEIYNHLLTQQQDKLEGILAELRDEAGLVIYNEALANAYEQYLGSSSIDLDLDLDEAGDGVEEDVIARVGDEEITRGQLFAQLTSDFAVQTTFRLLDPLILEDQFEVDPNQVEEALSDLKEELGDDFDAAVAEQGFESEEEVIAYLETVLLQEEAFNATFSPSEERLKELHEQIGISVSGSHILIGNKETDTPEDKAENKELATELIERLQDADDLPELFAELATEYSDCGSSENGGDLGSWERGQMVAEFDDAIFDLEVGEFTTEPIETQFGYHIIYKTGLEEVPEFEDVRDELEAQELSTLRQAGAMTSLLMDLRQDANIVFTNSVLQAQFEAMNSNE